MSFIRRISFDRPISDYAKVRALWSNFIRGNKNQLNRGSFKDKHYLNVGCGPNIEEKFINLDYGWRPGIDLCWDITKGIPLEDNSLLGIYTEHCLEHISFFDANQLLKEFFRLLKPNGTLRIVVPDAELYLNFYINGKADKGLKFPYDQSAYGMSDDGTTPMMVVNSVFRGHGHQFAYDYVTLKEMLKKQGFVNPKKESFKAGRDSTLLIDSEWRACESLYVEASAPYSEDAEF